MTWHREQRIRELEVELTRLRAEQAAEQTHAKHGWYPLERGGYRIASTTRRQLQLADKLRASALRNLHSDDK